MRWLITGKGMLSYSPSIAAASVKVLEGSATPDMQEGVATLRGVGIRYRAVLVPLSEDAATIDHVLGALNYRLLRGDEVRTTQVNFRRLPMALRNASNC
jgi:hypothetical protein